MKKIIICALLIVESCAIAMEQPFVFHCSDKKVELVRTQENQKKIEALHTTSQFIKNMKEDGVLVGDELDLKGITAEQLELTLDYLPHNNEKLEENCTLASRSKLENLIKSANYLDVPKLLDPVCSAFAKKCEAAIFDASTVKELEAVIKEWDTDAIAEVQDVIALKLFPTYKIATEDSTHFSRAIEKIDVTKSGASALILSHNFNSADENFEMWDLKENKLTFVLEEKKEKLHEMAMNGDGTIGFSHGVYECALGIWDLKKGKRLQSLDDHGWSVAINADGTKGFSGTVTDKFVSWDLSTGKTTGEYKAHTSTPTFAGTICVVPNDEGTIGFSRGVGYAVEVWDFKSGKCIHSYDEYDGCRIAINGEGSLLIAGSGGGDIALLDLRTNKPRWQKAHNQQVVSLAMSGDGSTAFTGDYDGSVFHWDLKTESIVQKFEMEKKAAVGLSKDGHIGILGDATGKMKKCTTTHSKQLSLAQAAVAAYSLFPVKEGSNLKHDKKEDDLNLYPLLKNTVFSLPKEIKQRCCWI